MLPLVSIIIPLFNMEGYVIRCIESAIGQTYKNIEIILVDDGSTDKTGRLCDDYSAKYAYIKVIHKKNQGLVSARKTGINISKGEYILPLDADDWIEPTMAETMVKSMVDNNIDFSQCGLIWECADGREIINDDILDEGAYDLSDPECKLYEKLFVGFGNGEKGGARLNICSCIFKRELLIRSQMIVPDNLCNGEDDACFFNATLQAKRFYKYSQPLYHSLVRQGSMSRSKEMFFIEQVFMIEKAVRPVLNNHLFSNQLTPRFNKYLLTLFNSYFTNHYGIGFHPVYRFDSTIIPMQSRVIIYGAGAVGQSYYLQMRDNYKIIAWIDQKRDNVNTVTINRVEDIRELNYDFIILAALKEATAFDMSNRLQLLNIPTEKIIWRAPRLSEGDYYFIFNN